MPRGLVGVLIAIAVALTGCSGTTTATTAPPSSAPSPSPNAPSSNVPTMCSSPGLPEHPVTRSDLVGRRYVATTYELCGVSHRLSSRIRFTLSFTAAVPGRHGDQFAFGTGVNSGGGDFAVTGDHLVVENLMQTLVGCVGAGCEQEGYLADVLAGHPRLSTRGDGTLLLIADRMTIPFRELRRDSVPKSFEKPR